jgi:hypothetical protein
MHQLHLPAFPSLLLWASAATVPSPPCPLLILASPSRCSLYRCFTPILLTCSAMSALGCWSASSST